MLWLCLVGASLLLSTAMLVFVVLLANRLSLVLPYLLCYHTLLLSADFSKWHCPYGWYKRQKGEKIAPGVDEEKADNTELAPQSALPEYP